MTQREDGRMALLRAVLEQQVEPVAAGHIEEARLEQALTSGPAFTANERQLLWLSPGTRNAYLAVKARVVAEMAERLQESGVHLAAAAMVAGGGADVLTVEGEGFKVVAQRHDGQPESWVVTLRLTARFRALLSPMTRLRLVDAGGLEWLCGRPNQQGEINAAWPHDDVSPRSRLAEYGLRIEPA